MSKIYTRQRIFDLEIWWIEKDLECKPQNKKRIRGIEFLSKAIPLWSSKVNIFMSKIYTRQRILDMKIWQIEIETKG